MVNSQIQLPFEFLNRMKENLGEDYPSFLRSYQEKRKRGIRVNTLKLPPDEFVRRIPFSMEKIPWIEGGFFAEEDAALSSHPFYAAGLYYIQEPSAMTPAALFPVHPGERVLDLCAAPGGKATAIAAKLQGTGLLLANDNSRTRARALLRNLELFGVRNALVTSAEADQLERIFPAHFDKIMLDAPCSGEGMFRKSEEARKSWSPEKVEQCAALQKKLLRSAIAMLRPGGLLMYSTCTFAPAEDEGNVAWTLQHFEEMHIVSLPQFPGFSEGRPEWGNGREDMHSCIRLWPHKIMGEGHFMALLQKAWPEETMPESPDVSETEGLERAVSQSLIGWTKESWKEPLWKSNRIIKTEGRQMSASGGLSADEKELLKKFESDSGMEPQGICPSGSDSGRIVQKGCLPGSDRQKLELAGNDGPAAMPTVSMKDRKKGSKKKVRRRKEDKRTAALERDQYQEITSIGGRVYREAMPLARFNLKGMEVFRNGLLLGEWKKKRFEPSQSLALAIGEKKKLNRLRLSPEDPRLSAYLKGEEITLTPEEEEAYAASAWILICADHFPVGWGKAVREKLKNKLPASWRR